MSLVDEASASVGSVCMSLRGYRWDSFGLTSSPSIRMEAMEIKLLESRKEMCQ
jgi:hypothetical protein